MAGWPLEGLETVKACPVCEADGGEPLHSGLTDRVHRCAPGEWSLRSCTRCRSAYLDPRPTPSTMALAYRDYHTHAPVLDGGGAGASLLARLRLALRNGYLNERFGYEFTPASRLGRPIVGAVPGARGIASHLVRDLANPAATGRLLDVGCGNGEFLARFRGTRWQLEGLEPDAAAVEFARAASLEVHHGSLDADALNLGPFDAITMSHVVEHLHDPVAGLRTCFELLRPGGTLWIATPNIGSSGHRAFGRDWYALEVPRHLVIFNRASLGLALRRAGFEEMPDPPVMPIAGLWMYRASAAIAKGHDPQSCRPPLDRKTAVSARLADLRALRNPETTEELVAVARRPVPA